MARPREDQVLEVDDLSSDLPSSMLIDGPTSTETEWCCSKPFIMRKTIPVKLKVTNRELEYSEEFGPSKPNNLDLFIIGGKLCSDPDWEQWRNSLRMTIGGHTISGLLGFSPSGESAHKHFCYFMNWQEKPPTNWFGKQAQNHGKEKEPLVRAFLLDDIAKSYPQDLYVSESILYELSSESKVPGVALSVCVTPDIHFTDGRISEIKCPYYNSDKYELPSEYEEDCQQRRAKKHGFSHCVEPSWFLQAAFYAWITGAKHFTVDVMYYTTQTDLFKVVSNTFYVCKQIQELFTEQVLYLLGEIAGSLEYQNKPNKKYKPAGGLLGCREKVRQAMDYSFNYIYSHKTYQYHMDGTWSRYETETRDGEHLASSIESDDSFGYLIFNQEHLF